MRALHESSISVPRKKGDVRNTSSYCLGMYSDHVSSYLRGCPKFLVDLRTGTDGPSEKGLRVGD